MFDVGFWELVVIGVVGLLVIGPQRLPQLASQLGRWAGQARGMARILKQQLRQEMAGMDPQRIMDPLPRSRDQAGTSGHRSGAGEQSPTRSDVDSPVAAPAAAATENPPTAGPPAA